MNESVGAKRVRLVDEKGEQLGIMDKEKAQAIAFEKGFDLLQVSKDIECPVCKLVDYNKYKYEKEKRLKESRKRQKTLHLKEVKIRPKISRHDLEVKEKYIQRFLEEHDKVKISVIFRGRELNNISQGREIMKELKDKFIQIATVEKDITKEGSTLQMIFVPKDKK